MSQNTTILNRILARHMSSLLQYLRGAGAWTAQGEQSAAAELRKLMDEDQEACKRLAEFIKRRRGVPHTGKFHQGFSSTHYMALEHFLPWLVSYQRWLIAQMDKDLGQLHGEEDALAAGRELLDMSRRHLTELECLVKSAGKPVSTLR